MTLTCSNAVHFHTHSGSWTDGIGPPPDNFGGLKLVDGDYYLDLSTGNIWRRTNGVYILLIEVVIEPAPFLSVPMVTGEMPGPVLLYDPFGQTVGVRVS